MALNPTFSAAPRLLIFRLQVFSSSTVPVPQAGPLSEPFRHQSWPGCPHSPLQEFTFGSIQSLPGMLDNSKKEVVLDPLLPRSVLLSSTLGF